MTHEKLSPKELEQKAGKAVEVAEKVKQVSKNKEVRERLYPLVERLDRSEYLEKFRTSWNKVPRPLQWAVMYLPGPSNFPGETIKLLVELGVIDYKGGIAEKDIEQRNKIERRFKTWAVKGAALFIPELKPILPLLEPIEKLGEIKSDILADVRAHVHEARAEREHQKEAEAVRRKLEEAA